MNVLLKEPWNPLMQRDVADLYVVDSGIANQVQTLASRIKEAEARQVMKHQKSEDTKQLSHKSRTCMPSAAYCIASVLWKSLPS